MADSLDHVADTAFKFMSLPASVVDDDHVVGTPNAADAANAADTGNTGSPPPPTPLKRLKFNGYTLLEMSEEKAWKLLLAASTGVAVLNLSVLPFLLPKFGRFIGAPFLPTRKRDVVRIFDDVLDGYLKQRCGLRGGRYIVRTHAVRFF